MIKKKSSDNGIMWKICMLVGGLGFGFCMFVYFVLFCSLFNERLSDAQKMQADFLWNANFYLLYGSLISMVVGRVGGWLLFNY